MHVDAKDKLSLGLRAKGEDFAARFGGGVDLYLNRNFVVALDADYVLPTGDLDSSVTDRPSRNFVPFSTC